MSETKSPEKPNNALPEIMRALSCDGRPVGPAEFKAFWNSCTEEEKAYYKTAPLI